MILLARELTIVKPTFTTTFIVILFMLVGGTTSVSGADQIFCVTTKIFVGDQRDPASEHQILFDQGLVYDVPVINRRFITVFDPAQKRVTLLDRDTQVQASVSTDDLIKITAQARASVKDDEQKKKLGMEAKVQTSEQRAGYSIKFANLEYHATTQKPEDPKVASDYAMFVDLASRLNLVRRLGPPPFGRMTLHQEFASRGELPLELTLTITGSKQTEQYRATHAIGDLADSDREVIQEVRGYLALYRQVDLKTFPK
jgi:hypothetical protein